MIHISDCFTRWKPCRSRSSPSGFEIKPTSFADLSAHINSCYGSTCFTEDTLRSYASHRVYAPDCWVAIADKHTGMIVASGIGELDLTAREGVLE